MISFCKQQAQTNPCAVPTPIVNRISTATASNSSIHTRSTVLHGPQCCSPPYHGLNVYPRRCGICCCAITKCWTTTMMMQYAFSFRYRDISERRAGHALSQFPPLHSSAYCISSHVIPRQPYIPPRTPRTPPISLVLRASGQTPDVLTIFDNGADYIWTCI